MVRWLASIGISVLLVGGISAVSASAEPASDRATAIADGQTRDVTPFAGTREIAAAAGSGSDQVFVPIRPCRVADTRAAGGKMAANTIRDFYISGTTGFAGQGGMIGGCGIPTNATAVELNITAPNASGNGWLRVWSANEAMPNATILSYTPMFNASNAAAVSICSTCPKQLRMQTFAYSTHVLLDVFGYYVDNVIPSYSIETATTSISASWYGTASATCPPGTTLIGGGAGGDALATYLGRSQPDGSGVWSSWVETDDGVAKSWEQHTYAICAKTSR